MVDIERFKRQKFSIIYGVIKMHAAAIPKIVVHAGLLWEGPDIAHIKRVVKGIIDTFYRA